MKPSVYLWIGACALLLGACGNSTSNSLGAATEGIDVPAARDLCVASACGEKIPLVDIPDAENIQFSNDGRLFVSGGTQVYEITKSGDIFSATPIADADCNFTGLAIRNDVLYAVCGTGPLFAGRIAAATTLTQIYTFVDMCIPNGADFGPDGQLYVVDEPLLPTCVPDPSIVRLRFDPADPMVVTNQETWVQGSPLGQLHLGLDNVLRFPNGLRREGSRFYGTDGGSLYSVDVLPDGLAGPVTPLYFTVAVHDDLGLVNGGILATDFAGGGISLVSREGTLLQQTDPATFNSPSSVRLAQPPMFRADDILVTEKGVLGDGGAAGIDKLSLFRRRSP